jgi:hypothetical protein
MLFSDMERLGRKLRRDPAGGVWFRCPGFDSVHQVRVAGPHAWGFNGDGDAPTFTPSVLVTQPRYQQAGLVCHSFVTAGRIRFLDDCTHQRAGQLVDLPDFD